MASPAPYTLCRVTQEEKTNWYVVFRDPTTGRRLTKKSVTILRKEMGDNSFAPILRREEAVAICEKALQKGYPSEEFHKETVRDNPFLGLYLIDFYDWDKSSYIKRKTTIDPGSISKDYMATRKNLIAKHVAPLVPAKMRLEETSVQFLEDLQYDLVKLTILSKETINMAMQATLFALREAQRRNLIPSTVVLAIPALKANHALRGVLTNTELEEYLAYAKKQKNRRLYLSAALSLLTGMRSGELRALTVGQIQNNMIVVDRAYANIQKEKAPKGKKTRIVPCPAFLCDELLAFAHTNLSCSKETLVFGSVHGGKHVSSHYFSEIFHKALIDSKILNEDDIVKRNISFHSFRHMANSYLRGSVDDYVLRLAIGHSSEQLSDLYTHLSEKAFRSIEIAQKEIILPLLDGGDRKPDNH